MMKIKTIAFLCAVMILAGCGEKKSVAHPNYKTLPDSAVLVRSCGLTLTKTDLEAQIDLRTALSQLRKRDFNEIDKGRVRQMVMPKSLKNFSDECVLVQYAKKHGLAATDEDRKPVEEKIVRTFLRRPAAFSELLSKLTPEQSQLLNAGIERQILAQKARLALSADFKPVTDEDIKARRKEMIAYNERACATNNAILAMANEAYAFLNKVQDFKAVGELYAMKPHVNYDDEWGPFEFTALTNDPQVVEWLKYAPVKTYSKPIEGDNGLMILKLQGKMPPDPDHGAKTDRYLFSRIFFELPGFWDAHETDEQMRKNLEAARRTDRYYEVFGALCQDAHIEFPYGEDYFVAKKGLKKGLKK